jgi:hypothetical protein
MNRAYRLKALRRALTRIGRHAAHAQSEATCDRPPTLDCLAQDALA